MMPSEQTRNIIWINVDIRVANLGHHTVYIIHFSLYK